MTAHHLPLASPRIAVTRGDRFHRFCHPTWRGIERVSSGWCIRGACGRMRPATYVGHRRLIGRLSRRRCRKASTTGIRALADITVDQALTSAERSEPVLTGHRRAAGIWPPHAMGVTLSTASPKG